MHRVLVIGTGSIGERHVRCLLNTNRAEVSICEINKKLLGDISAKYDISEAFDNLEAALEKSWDAGVIATPADLHTPIALKLAESKINVFIEKPLSTKLESVDELIETVRKNQLAAAAGYNYRAHPCISDMRDVIESGRFGRPIQVVATCGYHFPSYRPAYAKTYFADRDKGGGAIQDGLTHIINLCEWFVGPVEKLAADAGHKKLEGVKVEDTVHVICRHGDVPGCYTFNLHQAPYEITITVICEKGTLRFEVQESCWKWMVEPDSSWHEEKKVKLSRDEWFTIQENHFLNVLEGKDKPLCTLEEAYQTLKVNLAILKSVANPSGWQAVTAENV